MKHPVFLQGRKTVLRPLSKETDLDEAYVWMNTPEVTQYLRIRFPITYGEEARFFDGLNVPTPNEVHLSVEALDAGERKFIGFMGLREIRWVDRVATSGAVIGDPGYRGKGYGSDAKMSLLHYAFRTLGLRKVNSSVYSFNMRSLRYNEKCSYKEEGRRIKEVYRNGEFHDEILMAVFREDWEPLWEEYQRSGKLHSAL
ncbi:MAG: GNAT family protein [bacterium]|nr:GNAT family protein [bacterium]